MNNLIYLKSVSTLIEVLQGDSNKTVYIGSNQLTRNYSNPFKEGFHNANWNRAIKFNNQFIDAKNEQSDNLTYYKLDIDLYLDIDKQTIVCLSKKPKNRFITQLKEFNEQMIPKLVKGYNRNKVINDIDISWILKEYIDFEYVDSQPLNINRWIVDDKFEFNNKKYKWKVLLVKSDHVGVEITKYGQIIYYYSSYLTNISEKNLTTISSFIDLDNGVFYANGYYPLQPNKLILNIKIPDLYEQDRVKDAVYNQFEEYFKLDKLNNYHMFNITNDISYLSKLINEEYKTLNYLDLMKQLNNDFKELNMSYYVDIFNDEQLVKDIEQRVDKTNDEQINSFNIQKQRFKK